MGYDGQIIIMKKKVIEKAKEMFKNTSFSDIFINYLYAFQYPEDYEIPENEESKEIVWFSHDPFEEYFGENTLKNDEARIIEKSVYEDYFKWIENKVKTTTLYDLAIDRIEKYEADTYINIYLSLKDLTIDWNTECVVFQNDW